MGTGDMPGRKWVFCCKGEEGKPPRSLQKRPESLVWLSALKQERSPTMLLLLQALQSTGSQECY